MSKCQENPITATSLFASMTAETCDSDESDMEDEITVSTDDPVTTIISMSSMFECDNTLAGSPMIATEITEVSDYVTISASNIVDCNGNNIADDNDKDPNYIVESNSESDEVADETIGEPVRKRQKTIDEKRTRDKHNHPLRDSCANDTGCKMKCDQIISQNRRQEIWQSYWNMTYNERRKWLFETVDRASKKRCTKGEHISRRNMTYKYNFKDSEGASHNVCKTFFLTTLGYHKKNDKAVITALRCPLDTVTPAADRRGHHEPHNKIDRSVIREHVESFHPCISHYRRAHAPLRRYLPSDVNITRMYADFKEKHPDFKCGYDIYRGEVRTMNISFAKLGEEGCEICEDFKMNISSHNHCVSMEHVQSSIDTEQETLDDCQKCKTWIGHMRAARSSRKHYQTDAGSDRPLDTTVRSVDLQKVIMLPRMPGMKTAMFTPRIIAFHETFASVGKKDEQKGKKDNISVVWHEAIAGRKQEEIASTFVKALAQDRDTNHTVYWLDNCAAQNKNWCLFSTLVILVNGDTINNTDITLKYFERGHTFMSADSVHHGVEKEMSSKPGGNVYDFADFVNAVSASNSGHMQVIQVAAEDFRAWVGGQSTAKLRKPRPMLAELAQVQVRRGSQLLYYKRSHDDADFGEFDFLKKSFTMERPHVMRPGCRGISEQRKLGIVAKLCPLMPETRRDFWETLPVNGDRAEDNLDD